MYPETIQMKLMRFLPPLSWCQLPMRLEIWIALHYQQVESWLYAACFDQNQALQQETVCLPIIHLEQGISNYQWYGAANYEKYLLLSIGLNDACSCNRLLSTNDSTDYPAWTISDNVIDVFWVDRISTFLLQLMPYTTNQSSGFVTNIHFLCDTSTPCQKWTNNMCLSL